MASIEVLETDITKLEIDAIANAANTGLRHGGGVAGAISRAGGPPIQAESDDVAPDDDESDDAAEPSAEALHDDPLRGLANLRDEPALARVEGKCRRCRLEQEDTERPEIAALVGVGASQLLGREIWNGADDRATERYCLERPAELPKRTAERLMHVAGRLSRRRDCDDARQRSQEGRWAFGISEGSSSDGGDCHKRGRMSAKYDERDELDDERRAHRRTTVRRCRLRRERRDQHRSDNERAEFHRPLRREAGPITEEESRRERCGNHGQ